MNVKQVIMTKGLPGSGKTTWAKEFQFDNPGKFKRVNKDELRSMLDNGKYSRANEKMVLALRDAIVIESLSNNRSVIVDDTNLASKHEARLKQLAQQRGATFSVKDFTGVSLQECLLSEI